MFTKFIRKAFGSANERKIKKFAPLVSQINHLEASLEKVSDEDLKNKTAEFKNRLSSGSTLDDILPEAFAVVREASKRILSMRHFDVQLLGGIILHKGMITEMKTGEGKTLVATLPAYLNALAEKGVHIITVNDYLAKRDSEWMGQIFRFLDLTVDCITNDMDDEPRQAAYHADITYGTNNEFGFDYLRDNMKFRQDDLVQRPVNFAIIDEVDSILIDEARTPLIISGPAEESSQLYKHVNQIVPLLKPEDYEKDEKAKNITLTETGIQNSEDLLKAHGLLKSGGLYDFQNVSLVHHINQALRAHKMFANDVDYIVQNNKVVLIDEFTGRMMEGRRYSDGLHQALEAKENVEIQTENQTLASITFQNLFRMYPKLSGMTGTAATEAAEFAEIYNLEVVELPTNKPMARKDYDDEIYRTGTEKYEAIVKVVKECLERKQPVLVGTASIEKSELLSSVFKKHKVPHQVLNARHHASEAQIIAQAGHPGAITIATNMAGRGTDIKLGGNSEMRISQELLKVTDPEERKKRAAKIEQEVAEAANYVKDLGGLYIIGTERHESRRIDNQLRGRGGRQGDPGASKFFLSLEDDLMRIFGSERLDKMLQRLGLKEGESITHPWVNKAIERAQQKVEARNFDIRKHLLKYDDVMNDQRIAIYTLRRELMTEENAKDTIEDMIDDLVDGLIASYIPPNTYPEQWSVHSLHEETRRLFNLDLPIKSWADEDGIADEEMKQRLLSAVEAHLKEKESQYGEGLMRAAEKSLLLRLLDNVWKDHLLSLDHLREGINLRAYAQRDPLNEYKQEAFNMFEGMLQNLRESVLSALSHLEFKSDQDEEEILESVDEYDDEEFDYSTPEDALIRPTQPEPRRKRKDRVPKTPTPDLQGADVKLGSFTPPGSRNTYCPCGSGKRYKHCHGKL